MRKIVLCVIISCFVLATSLTGIALSAAARDCDENAIINCGAYTKGELNDGWSAHAGVQCLYSYFGISQTDVRNIETNSTEGLVTKDGRVIVDGRVVATNAITAGRQDPQNVSTPYNCGGTTFYLRHPNVSFESNSLSAFVVMDENSRFDYAIINSCGNPVMATPVTQKVTKKSVAKPTPVAPTVPTTPVAQTQTQTQSQIVNVSQPVVSAAQTQPATQTSPPAAKTIPNTGPGPALGVSAIAGVIGTLGHLLYRRILSRY